jgi:hypothetical protein
MKFSDGEFFGIMGLKNDFGIQTNPDESETVEGCRRVIDRTNERAVANGYKPGRFLIVRHIWNTVYYPDGTFCEANEKTQKVEIYPPEI